LLHLFFAVVPLKLGLERGVIWQRHFVALCLIQLTMQVVIYTTIEVAILQFLLPNSARADVKAVFAHLLRMIEQLCGSTDRVAPNIALNATNYFFVSTRLAASYPGLPESIVISEFRSPLLAPFLPLS
jgi:hypothetical protein